MVVGRQQRVGLPPQIWTARGQQPPLQQLRLDPQDELFGLFCVAQPPPPQVAAWQTGGAGQQLPLQHV